MWQSIEKSLSNKLGEQYKIINQVPLTGGDINRAYKIDNGKTSYFVKVNDKTHIAHFGCEVYSLEKIQEVKELNTPNVVTYGVANDCSYLVLDYIPFDVKASSDWYHLGEKLAYMHNNSEHGQFGWEHDNYIGHTQQTNPWSSNWKTFFSEQRIGWQLQLLHEKGIHIGDIDHLVKECHDGLNHHTPKPRLVHGDLWSGNLAFVDNAPLVYDPACYYGDREVDLAMTELFGCLPANFYKGYQSVNPIDSGYDKRKNIYNFYHVLNHANLFGGIYIEQSQALIKRIIAQNKH